LVAQYAPLLGVLELRQAAAAYAEAAHPGLAVDPATETLITLGATEGLACAMLALLNPGDEVNRPAPSREVAVP
jgi:aspartate/methionine/tyrosine aminotransferase